MDAIGFIFLEIVICNFFIFSTSISPNFLTDLLIESPCKSFLLRYFFISYFLCVPLRIFVAKIRGILKNS